MLKYVGVKLVLPVPELLNLNANAYKIIIICKT